MIDCLIVGDSIAVGVHAHRPECAVHAKVGWNTMQWNRDYLKNDLGANTVIISLGSNDHGGIDTRAELIKMRNRIQGSRVFWIIPAKKDVQSVVYNIANQYNDIVLHISSLQPDGIHPTIKGYKALAAATK